MPSSKAKGREPGSSTGRPIHQPIEKNAQIDAAFDTITYGKGGHVVAMIAAFMGDTKFRDGVRGYMAAHKYGNATSAEFFKAMAEAGILQEALRVVAAIQKGAEDGQLVNAMHLEKSMTDADKRPSTSNDICQL